MASYPSESLRGFVTMIHRQYYQRRMLGITIVLLSFLVVSDAMGDFVVWQRRHSDLSGAQDFVVSRHSTYQAANADARARNLANSDLAVYYDAMKASPGSPDARIVANTVSKVDELMRQSRDVAAAEGRQFPEAGNVLGEYAEAAKLAYSNASELKKEYSKFANDGTQKLIKELDSVLDKQARLEGERAVYKQTLQTAQEQAGRQGLALDDSLENMISEVTKTSDPKRRSELIAKLRSEVTTDGFKKREISRTEKQLAIAKSSNMEKNLKANRDDLAALEGDRKRIDGQLRSSVPATAKKSVPESVPKAKSINNDLIGRWRRIENTIDGSYYEYEFRADGTGTHKNVINPRQGNAPVWQDNFRYKVDGNVIELSMTSGYNAGSQRTLTFRSGSIGSDWFKQ